MSSIINYAKKVVTPSQKLQQKKQRIVKKVCGLISQNIKKYPIVGFEIGGSYAKGTWLPEKADIDIFVKFNKKTSEKDFRNFGTKIGFQSLKKFKPYTRYAEHPFVEAVVDGTKINIVPCYNVKKGEWKSAADRSIHHTKFMSQKLSDSMKEEVRILKKFFLHIGVYGAEIAKEGFSGYVSEVLISYFGSFEKTIKKISELKKGQVIGKSTKKFDSPIVIIDPVDNNRNLGTAISMDNLGKFVLASRVFLKNPSKKFFKKPVSKRIMKNVDKIIVVQFRVKDRSDDIIWGQIKRASNALKTQLGLGGFTVLRNSSVKDEKSNAALIFLLHTKKIETEFTNKSAIFIGLFQVLALIPGVSRSGITITSGRMLGFNRFDSAKISFFLSIPTLAAASIIGIYNIYKERSAELNFLAIIAVIFAFIFSYIKNSCMNFWM